MYHFYIIIFVTTRHTLYSYMNVIHTLLSHEWDTKLYSYMNVTPILQLQERDTLYSYK